jgi:hypothetical protein
MRKAALVAAFFIFYSIDSEYQTGARLLPFLGGYFGAEVLWNQLRLPWFGMEGVDTISTERGKNKNYGFLILWSLLINKGEYKRGIT